MEVEAAAISFREALPELHPALDGIPHFLEDGLAFQDAPGLLEVLAFAPGKGRGEGDGAVESALAVDEGGAEAAVEFDGLVEPGLVDAGIVPDGEDEGGEACGVGEADIVGWAEDTPDPEFKPASRVDAGLLSVCGVGLPDRLRDLSEDHWLVIRW